MAITYPLILPPQGIRSISIRPNNVVALTRSPFTGQQQVQAHQGQWWEADVEFPPMKQSGYADDIAAFITSLRGQYGTFLLGDSSRKTPRGSVLLGSNTVSPFVYGASQTGMTLVTRGWATDTAIVLKAGDYVQIGSGNLLTESSSFDGVSWTKSNVTVTANSVVSPVGTTTGDTLTAGSGDCNVIQYFNTRNVGDHTFSVWLRCASGTVSTAIGVGDYTFTQTAVTVTTSWQRFTVTHKCLLSSAAAAIGRSTDIPDGAVIYAWGGQVNYGTTVDAYQPTSGAVVTPTARLHKVIADASTDSNGQATLQIWPRLRESPSDLAPLKTSNCVGTFRLADNNHGWSVDPAKIYSAGISAVEAI